MIKINDRFSTERDPHCWILYETKQSINKKTGKPAETKTATYHMNIVQVCENILNLSAGECKNIEDVKDLFANAVEMLVDNFNKPKRSRRRN